MRTAPAMSAAGQSLEMKPAAPAARAAFGEMPPGAGDQQHVRVGGERRAAARRSRRPTPGRRTGRRARRAARSGASARAPRRRCARSGSARPTAARRASAGSPSARPRGRRRPARAGARSAAAGREPARVDVRHAQAAPPAARARCPARARRTRRSRRPAAPRARRAAGPCPVAGAAARARRRCTTSSTNAPSLARRSGTSTRRRLGVLVRVAHRLGEHRLRERLELRAARSTRAAGVERRGRGRGCSRRRRSTSSAASSASRGAARPSGRCSARAQVAQRGLQLGADALARLARSSSASARERQRHAEQPLDHALVDLAREVDALLQLRARAACWSVASARAARRARRSCRASTAGGARRRSAASRRRRSERITPIQRPAAAIGTQTSVRLAQQRRGTRSGSSRATALARPR